MNNFYTLLLSRERKISQYANQQLTRTNLLPYPLHIMREACVTEKGLERVKGMSNGWKLFHKKIRKLTQTLGVIRNRPFPSSLVPLFQRESKCETILMKMTFICMKKKLRTELIFI